MASMTTTRGAMVAGWAPGPVRGNGGGVMTGGVGDEGVVWLGVVDGAREGRGRVDVAGRHRARGPGEAAGGVALPGGRGRRRIGVGLGRVRRRRLRCGRLRRV